MVGFHDVLSDLDHQACLPPKLEGTVPDQEQISHPHHVHDPVFDFRLHGLNRDRRESAQREGHQPLLACEYCVKSIKG